MKTDPPRPGGPKAQPAQAPGTTTSMAARRLKRPDGTCLRWFDSGGTGPALILANGLGGPISAFHPHIERLRDEFRLISWDYRGTYGSRLPSTNVALDVPVHAQDLMAILDTAQVMRCAFLGWSMGVQVGLELVARAPERVSHMICVSGTYGSPFSGVPLPQARRLLPPLVRGAGRVHRLGSWFLEGASRAPFTCRTLKAIRFIAPTFEEEQFRVLISQFKTLDLSNYFRLLELLGAHDAEDMLQMLRLPLCIVVGDRDILTPQRVARTFQERVPGAELHVIAGGSHYAAAEYPDQLVEIVRDFVERHN